MGDGVTRKVVVFSGYMRRHEPVSGLIESGEIVGNSQMPMLTSAQLRDLSISNVSEELSPPSVPDDSMSHQSPVRSRP